MGPQQLLGRTHLAMTVVDDPLHTPDVLSRVQILPKHSTALLQGIADLKQDHEWSRRTVHHTLKGSQVQRQKLCNNTYFAMA